MLKRRRRWFFCRQLAFATGIVFVLSRVDSTSAAPITVTESIQTSRLLGATEIWVGDAGHQTWKIYPKYVFQSPSKKWFVLMLMKGDVTANGNWLTILSGSLGSLDLASHLTEIGRLFMSSLGGNEVGHGTTLLTHPRWARLAWLDSDRFLFLWGDSNNVSQIFCANIAARTVTPWTNSKTEVLPFFDVSSTGRLIYAAIENHSASESKRLLNEGFVVKNNDIFSLLRGDVDGYSDRLWGNNLFILEHGKEPTKVVLGRNGFNPVFPTIVSVSPDGHAAIVNGPVQGVPKAWDSYTERWTKLRVESFRQSGADSLEARLLCQLYVVDMDTGVAKALWEAPTPPYANAVWAPDSRSVLVGPALLPLSDYRDGSALNGNSVAEVDVVTGRIMRLPLQKAFRGDGVVRLAWHGRNEVSVVSGTGSGTYHRYSSGWQYEGEATVLDDDGKNAGEVADHSVNSSRMRVEVREGLNTPPRVFAIDTVTRREQLVLDLNPNLDDSSRLGRIEGVTWSDRHQRQWHGRLYYPVGYAPSKRYPLVIQTHGFAPLSEFSLYGMSGPGLGPHESVYAAEPLAGRAIAVLQLEDKADFAASPKEPEMYMQAYEDAVAHFAETGLVDRSRVGLLGWSRTGWHIQYALTHSSYPYAAAVVSDAHDPSYFVTTAASEWNGEIEADVGAPAFGSGLKVWLENSPGFNAEKVHTPLRITQQGPGLPGLLMSWELFSRLRFLKRPVELYIPPDVEHANHGLQNPRQLLALEEGTVDWFDFWLNDREDAAPDKREQYRRWRVLRSQRNALRDALAHNSVEQR